MQKLKSKSTPTVFDASGKARGVKRVLLASGNSLRALRWLAVNEAAFRQELVLTLAALPLLALWQITVYEKALLLTSLIVVLFAEVVNTAIEVVVDRISFDIHPLSGLAKDLGSLGVMLALIIAGICWGSVLVYHLV